MTEFKAGDVIRYRGSFEGFTSLSFTDVRRHDIGIILNEMVEESTTCDDRDQLSRRACSYVTDEDLGRCRTRYFRCWFDGIVEYVSDMDIEAVDD